METEQKENTGMGQKRVMTLLGFGLIGTAGIAILVGVVLYFFSPTSPAQTPPAEPSPSTLPVVNTISVTSYELVSQKRISRTVSEYTYRVSVRNDGPALIVVSGTASSPSTAATFTDNAVTLGDIASNTPAVSSDTFTIRQDRTKSFSTNDLAWEFRAAPGEGIPPGPDPVLNNATVAGIDSDNDGVRDDIERFLAIEFGSSPTLHDELFTFARAEQALISSPSAASIDSYKQRVSCAMDRGLSADELDRVTAISLNTIERSRAYGLALLSFTHMFGGHQEPDFDIGEP